MKKIVITGGPCAGKTTCLVQISERLSNLGYQVYVVPEAARILFGGAGRPTRSQLGKLLKYQRVMIQMILDLEDRFASLHSNDEKAVMIMDRGVLDGKGFMEESEWQAILHDLGLNEFQLLQRYDAVIHLVTTADGAQHAYALDTIRNETPEEAVAADKLLQTAYLGHGHFKIIDNSTEFEAKLRRVSEEVCRILGEPEPLELERRYMLGKNLIFPSGVITNTSEIEQIYLKSDTVDERRIRKRTSGGYTVFTRTLKREIEPGKRIEKDEFVTGTEFLGLKRDADPKCSTLYKTRHCFVFNRRCYELDEYHRQLDGLRILEIEVEDLNQVVQIPEWMGPVIEVTNNPNLSNKALSRNFAVQA